jgi:hypothetical protein
MKNVKLVSFVFTLFCTALVSNLLLSCFLFFSDNEHMNRSDFNEILIDDLIVSGAVVLVLFLMLRKQLVGTFSQMT